MDIAIFIIEFLFRIRHKILIFSITIGLFVAYFSQFMPKTYSVSTSIFTGIVSEKGLTNEETHKDVNNIFDNLINLTTASSTLERVSTKLFALCIINGNPNNNTLAINAETYKNIIKGTPPEVLKLINKNSLDSTIMNINEYKKAVPGNFFYNLFNNDAGYFTFNNLSGVQVRRMGNSDIIKIAYSSSDPGITTNTVTLIKDELLASYDRLRYSNTNDVISYYVKELDKYKKLLTEKEDILRDYYIKYNIMNYRDQTAQLAIEMSDLGSRIETAEKNIASSTSLINSLDEQMNIRAELNMSNSAFVSTLADITSINGKITELEIMNTSSNSPNLTEINEYKKKLAAKEKEIVVLSNKMSHAKYTKEGVSLKNMINEWLMSYITSIKTKAELKVLVARRKELFNEQQKLAPVGTGINRRERAVKITESSYMAALNALNTAKMLEKNVQLTTANLTTIGEPQYPLSGTSKRLILVIAATFGSAIFIIGIYLIIELLDHTLRDPFRASRLSSLPVFSVFTGYRQKSYRGYIKACNRTTAAFTCNKLNSYLKPDQTLYINILSIDSKEGKSFIISYMKDFWTSLGLKVESFSYETDFSTKKATYLMAKNYASLNAPKANIVLVEHPPLETCSLPSSLLKEATVNLLVANAKRAWTNSDDEYINQIKENKSSHLFMILNNVTRDVAEDFIGKIPPAHSRGTLSKKIRHMALTASDTSSVR